MKFSYQWIREFVKGLDAEATALERLITTRTAECDGIETAGAPLAEASVATVVGIHMTGGHYTTALVDTELYGQKKVVCGAPNCRGGMRTVYVPVGTKLVHGVESDGMLASGQELGINRDHTGIVELKGSLPKPDQIIEIDNKSLTHRPDLWGHYGMAREVAAITGNELLDPVKMDLLPTGDPAVRIEIEDFDLCPRFSALVFENIKVQPSPLWLQYRLTAIGLNPINNIVDLTNYIMAELAQPMHAYDRGLVKGGVLRARRAHEGEQVYALNKETYICNPSNLVIADDGGPVGLAGVMGGQDSSITDSTTSIILEAANFNASSVRKTSSAHKIRTDASMRFEKAQDPVNTTRALARAIELLQELSPGARLVGGLADVKRPFPALPSVKLNLDWLNRKLGREVPSTEVRSILERLQFTVTEDFTVTVPSWRATKDISVADDLVEEVGRMIGYESIPPVAPAVASVVPPDFPERSYFRRLRAFLTARGFTDVYNYSFLSEEQVREFGLNPAEHVRVLNPIAANQSLMRTSLLPGVYANLIENRKNFPTCRLFEIGREIHKREGRLPDEVPHLVCAIYGDDNGLYELKRIAESLANGIAVEATEARSYEHPTRTASVNPGGRLFELHPKMIEGRAHILDLDLRAIMPLEPHASKYKPIRRYPSSSFDLTVLTTPRKPVATVQQDFSIPSPGTSLIPERIEFIRQFIKSEDIKSVTFRFTLGAPDRTLSSDEVTAFRDAAIARMRDLGYNLTV
jgi:phenylalanyl-tRNA synthetase beta chain